VEQSSKTIARISKNAKNPHPNPLPEYMERGKKVRCDCRMDQNNQGIKNQ